MIGSDSLDTVHFHLDPLAGAQLGDEDIGVHRLNGIVILEIVLLSSNGVERNILGIDMGVVVEFARILLSRGSIRILRAFDIETQHDSIVIARRATGAGVILIRRLFEPAHPIETLYRTLQGNETKARGKNLILDHGGVLMDEDVLDRKGRDLSDEDTAESVCDRCVKSDEGK